MARLTLVCMCLSLLLLGCGQDTPQPNDNDTDPETETSAVDLSKLDPSRQTPKAAFTALRAAWNAEDYETAITYLTPQAQQSVVASHAVLIGLWQGMGTQEMRDSELGQALEAMFVERGIDSMGMRLKEIGGEIIPPGEDDDPYRVQMLLTLARELGDPLTFVQDLNQLDRQFNAAREFALRLAPMNEVTIDGDTAEGWMGNPNAGELSLDFRLTDEGWMIDKLFMHPVYEPGGNISRFEGEIQE